MSSPEAVVPPLTNVVPRLFLLVLLVLLVNGWLSAHRGVDLKVLLSVEVAVGVLEPLRARLRPNDNAAIDRFAQRLVYVLLGTRFLLVVWALFLLLSSTVSTVNVMAGGVPRLGKVTLAEEHSGGTAAEEELAAADDVARFTRFTTPFGRPYYLTIAGYRRRSFDLYPWFPKNIRVPVEMDVAPSVLLRVPYPHYDLVGGEIEVRDPVTRRLIVSAVPTTASSAALLLGGDATIPESAVVAWTRQLNALGVLPAAQSAPVEAWLTPQPSPQAVGLEPGTRLEAVFLEESQVKAKNGTPAARVVFTVSGAPFQDVLMKDERKMP